MEFWAYSIVMHKTIKAASDNLNLKNFIKQQEMFKNFRARLIQMAWKKNYLYRIGPDFPRVGQVDKYRNLRHL